MDAEGQDTGRLSPRDEVERILLESRCSMFHPRSRGDLLLEYPELREVMSLVALKARPKDQMFVWFYASKTSYAQSMIDDRKRIEFALKAAYGPKVDKKVKDAFLNHKWGDDIAAAIQDMRRFEPSVRVKNKVYAERMLRNLEIVARMDLSRYETVAPDWDDMQKALKAIREAGEMIPVIQKLAEGDFGITISEGGDEPDGLEWSLAGETKLQEV